MEHKIGEIVTFPNGRKAKVVVNKDGFCDGCIFESYHCQEFEEFGFFPNCIPAFRADHKNIIYKEVKE